MADKRIGIVGIGLMGHGIATNIQRNGRKISLLDHPGNQDIGKLVEDGAQVFKSPKELAQENEIIILCVTGSPEVEAVLTDEHGILSGLASGTTIIDCSTAIPSSTIKMARLVSDAGGSFLDAPMTRTPKEAAEGRLNLIVGGERALFDDMLPLFRCFAENVVYAGKTGSGHSLKLLHNFVSLGHSAVLAEAAAAARKAEIDPATFVEVLNKGGGHGVVLDRMAPYILDGDLESFRFSLANGAKDTGYYKEMSQDLALNGVLAEAVCRLYQQQVDNGDGAKYVPEMIEQIN
ncbi:MAG: NAD(P)-dependent oxidoreductase [Pseudomonadota bacterium]